MNIEQIKVTGHVTTLNGLPGMSSQEIAEITGKRHKNVLRDIQKMIEEIGSNLSPLQVVETRAPDSYGRLQPLTILDKELTFTLLSRYSFKLSNLIVKRWLELEGSGFVRVSVQGAMVHLVEREKDTRAAAFRSLKGRRTLSPAQKERKKLDHRANSEANRQRKAGHDWH